MIETTIKDLLDIRKRLVKKKLPEAADLVRIVDILILYIKREIT